MWVIFDGWAAFFLWLIKWDTISNSRILYDFSNLYQTGKWWLSGAYVNCQTHSILSYTFAYPPSSLPFFGFFAQFDFGVAAQLWTGIGLAMFLVALLSATYTLEPARRYLFLSIALILFFTSYALRAELQLGQINMLLAGLTILSLVAHRSSHLRISATLLAAGTLLKGPPMLFLVYFVVFHRDLRYLIYFLESASAMVGISFLFIPVQLYWTWTFNVLPTLLVAAALPINESLTGAVSMSGLGYLTPGLFVAGICMFATFAYRAYPRSLTKQVSSTSVFVDAMFLMNSLVILLLGTRSWIQDFVWVIIPATLFLSALLVQGVKSSYFVIVAVAAFLFNCSTYPLFMYYFNYYPTMAYYLPYAEMVPTGLMGGLLIAPALILLFMYPHSILQHRADPLAPG
jgi:hypothetical protein